MTNQKIVFKNAAKIYVAIVGFYFFMKLIGMSDIIEFRILNILFVIWGINSSIKNNIFQNMDNNYLTNLSIGFSTGLLGILGVITSMVIYITLIDDSLMMTLQTTSFWGNNLTLPKVVFSMTIEAMASCVISTFILMQYWKKHKIESLIKHS
ncbi:hypothetical protein AXE80_07810 [Wenyingzhuangia fucanilytica]|uniref:DUF4199 domain-containing protein n=1 Tax=Wenyingzhuangia fucanilytica TaxID=1790137 RepID=A0A1B1Y627_9FLAO|nr:hypothetical protein [Wenyingzhuangia fucanilytica]ANW96188.1 hypothetical protein AXE80_07810 [Wenyingzhuangia fucanilytica]